MIERRTLLMNSALGLAGLPVLASASAEAAAATGSSPAPASQVERNKQIILAGDVEGQFNVLPPTMPGGTDKPHGALGAGAEHLELFACYDPPGGVDDPKSTIAAIAGWHVQSTAPPFHSWGPFIAEGNSVVIEREVFFHGLDGTMYNNVYCFIYTVKDGKVTGMREYLDSHHAVVILGLHAKWDVHAPSRAPRRRWRGPVQSSIGLPPLTEMEVGFPIRQEFTLDPKMLRDVIATGDSPQRFPDTAEGNKAVVRAMRDAQAKGDIAAVNALHGKGYRLYIGGEGPLGWEHIPVEDIYAPLVKHLDGPIKIRFSELVAEGGRVFEEMDILAKLDDGTVYNNW
ncbi:MAG: hypothetical protein JWR77_2020, partial [Rhizorhabdus sp.]|nr:hypothetical protein [Rhizorhabdus sp.]